jgi:hypothetical protein
MLTLRVHEDCVGKTKVIEYGREQCAVAFSWQVTLFKKKIFLQLEIF